MTIEQICLQIDRRLADARDEIKRLEAARAALGKDADTTRALSPETSGGTRRPTRRRARRRPRGTTRQAVLSALVDGPAMTAGQLAAATGLRRETIAPELTKLVKVGELVKADRGYKIPLDDATVTTRRAASSGSGTGRRQKSAAAAALGRELDAGLRTRV
jgi:predicted transcriptional regulator